MISNRLDERCVIMKMNVDKVNVISRFLGEDDDFDDVLTDEDLYDIKYIKENKIRRNPVTMRV